VLIEQIENAENTDPVAVFALREIFIIWRIVAARPLEPGIGMHTFWRLKFPILQMQEHKKGEPVTIRPIELRPFGQSRVRV